MSAKDFVEIFNKSVSDRVEATKSWVAVLRNKGVKAAHPNDGWVDRGLKNVKFCYPNFNDGVVVGDRIALGNYSKSTIVNVVKITEDKYFGSGKTYHYK